MGDEAIQPLPKQGLRPWHKKLIFIAMILLAMGACYLTGRLQTSGKIDEAQAETAALGEKAAGYQGEAAKQKQRVQELEARRQLHLVLLSLDARNFGIAKQHQEQAARLLKTTNPAGDSELAKLLAEVQSYSLVATEDLAQQRRTVLGWAQQFDKLVPPPEAQ